ncbi:DUF2789 family protein [Burkholderiaceae bacterium UC74_6]
MDTTTHHSISELFAQLGLPSSSAEIFRFIELHRPLPLQLNLSEAPFWTNSQITFLKEEWHADNGDWALLIDQLSALLREHPTQDELRPAWDGR